MPELREIMDRLKRTEREYDAVAQIVHHHRMLIRQGSTGLPLAASPRDFDSAARLLGPTYLVRVWAEFETALRSYRRHLTGDAEDRIGSKHLIDWVAGIKQGRAIPESTRRDVHQVRDYRNFLVHERDDVDPPDPVPIDEARRRPNIYLQKLPERW